jgi:hypothetical protein
MHVAQRDRESTPGAPGQLSCHYRAPEDDFFCLRYQVWYPSFDCAVRTRFRTAPGCLGCDQGRFNHSRHRVRLGTLPGRLLRLYSHG